MIGFIVLNNVPESVQGKQGFEGFQKWFFQEPDWWSRWKKRGKVLLTTRKGCFGSEDDRIKEIDVGRLQKETAMEILLDGVSPEYADREVAEKLAKSFQWVPHALWACNGDLRQRLRREETLTMNVYLERGKFKDNDNAAEVLYRGSLDNAFELGYGAILDVAAFVSPDEIPLVLLQNKQCDGRTGGGTC